MSLVPFPRWTIAAIVFGVAHLSDGYSADIDIDLTLGEIYSNNITLRPDELALADFVTRIRPSVNLTADTKAVEGALTYTFETLIYAEHSEFNDSYHSLDAYSRFNLVDDQLQLIGVTRYTQINVDPTQPNTNSNLNVTGNRSNAFFGELGPALYRDLPLNSHIDTYYNYGRIIYEDPDSQDVDSQRVGLRLSSISDTGQSLAYDLDYRLWSLDYETSGDITEQELTFTLGREIRTGLEISGLFGMDSNFANAEDSSLAEPRWEVGVDLSGLNGQLSAAVGHRYFGQILRLNARRTVSSWFFSASYSEEPGTGEGIAIREISNDEVPDDRLPPPDAGIDEPGTAARFFRKRGDVQIGWEGHRSGVDLRAWQDRRINVPNNTTDPGAISTDGAKSIGAIASYWWQAGARTAFDCRISWTNRKFADVTLDDTSSGIDGAKIDPTDNILTWGVSGTMRYELGEKTELNSNVRWTDATSDLNISNNYTEFRASIEISRKFL